MIEVDKPGMTSAQIDTLIALVERGPLDDGDVPSKTGRDGLIDAGLACRVICSGEDGHTAATYKGRDAYTAMYGSGTLREAMANRKRQRQTMPAPAPPPPPSARVVSEDRRPSWTEKPCQEPEGLTRDRKTTERAFPVLHAPAGCPKYVKWSALSDYWARKSHRQSLERLAERGGLSPLEIVVNIGLKWDSFATITKEGCVEVVKGIEFKGE